MIEAREALRKLLAELTAQQTHCPLCGGEHVHAERCALIGYWHFGRRS